jgi:hypothetical protein
LKHKTALSPLAEERAVVVATILEFAEKVGVATEAFAAAKAGRSFRSLSGMTKVMPCYKAPLKRVFRKLFSRPGQR